MALQFSIPLRTAIAAQIPPLLRTLKLFSGAEPANCAAGDPSGLLCTLSLPSPSLTAANGQGVLAGTWSGIASGIGTAASFRGYDAQGACHVQGDAISDLALNNARLSVGQTVLVSGFAVTVDNA
jgi:hypothetical protein